MHNLFHYGISYLFILLVNIRRYCNDKSNKVIIHVGTKTKNKTFFEIAISTNKMFFV